MPISPTQRLAALLLLPALLAGAARADGLPELGDASQAVLSPQQERRIGEEIMREIRADKSYLDDAELSDYLNQLGHRLASANASGRQDFEFFAIRDPMVNAFALPGGFIGVHTGLLLTAQTESELAAVLAHEIAHVTQKHLARMVAGQRPQQITSLLALAVAILAARSNAQVAQAAMATAQAAAIQSQLDYTRDHEREADRIGLAILEQAGFDSRGMPAFLERMQRATRLYEGNAPAYLRTHPLTFERIADVQNRTQTLPYRQVSDSLDFQLLRAKLRAEDGKPQEAVAYFEHGLAEKRYTSEAAQRYGLVAALLRAREPQRAARDFATLSAHAPQHPMIEALGGRVKLALGQGSQALAQYRAALKRFPGNRALTLDFATALLAEGQAQSALKLLAEQAQLRGADARLYRLQAKAYASLGKQLMQHQALAEAYAREGNVGAAIEQLQIAVRAGDGDFYQLSSAEARLRELKLLDAASRKAEGDPKTRLGQDNKAGLFLH